MGFHVKVTYPNKPAKFHNATVGGGEMTAEQLGEHYEATNHFPGATSVEISETAFVDNSPNLAKAVNVRPKVTPKALIVAKPTEEPAETQETPETEQEQSATPTPLKRPIARPKP